MSYQKNHFRGTIWRSKFLPPLKDPGTKNVRRPQAVVLGCDVLIIALSNLDIYHLTQKSEIRKLYPRAGAVFVPEQFEHRTLKLAS
jgi:hypothetical protein